LRGPLSSWLLKDHERLDAILRRAVADPGRIDREAFELFRGGLLRHIAIEEKILLPAVRKARSGKPHPTARHLRVDHGAICSLLVPTPNAEIVAELGSILGPHNALEEAEGGFYEACDDLLSTDAGSLLERMEKYPAVKTAPHRDGIGVYRTARDASRASARQREHSD